MLKPILSMLRSGATKQKNRPSIRARRAQLEQLEDRRLLSITGVSDIAGLRAALDTYNGTSDDDTINVAAGTYTLSGAKLDNANVSGDLDITKTGGSLTIQGAGAGATFIDANDVDRVLHITGATTVTLADLTIRNGATDDDGATSGQAFGGGILISGAADVTLDNVTVTSNTATGLAGVANGSAGQAAYGGGIAIVNAAASLTLTDTSVTANALVGGAGHAGADGGSWLNGGAGGQGGAALGGAIYIVGGDVLVTGTSSLTSNTATGGIGGDGGRGGYTTFNGYGGATGGSGGTASGGGVFVSSGSLSVPVSGAISSNTATGGQGGAGGPGGTSMNTGPQGVGGTGGLAYGGGVYFTDGNMAAIQSGAVASNTVTGGSGGAGNPAGATGSTSDTDSGRQASTLSVTVEQAGGQSDPTAAQPVYFTVTFSESVSNFATGDVTIAGTTGASTATVTGSGTTYTVAVSGATSNGWVSAYVPAGAATNAGATPNGASSSADNVVVLSGGDYVAPTISSTTPTDNATGVDPAANLSITFDENVAKGTGNISIYDSGDSLSEAIDVTSGQVTVSGATVTINPTNTLTDLTGYYVQIDATAIDDTAGNSFAGISDTTTWSFTTADTTGPTISSTVPADDATGIDPTADLSVTFNENVAKGTGNISIYDSGDSLFEAIDVTSGQVTVSGANVTINPTNTLTDLTGYYVQIDATAIDDTAGNSFAGIGDTTTWSFTTADTTGPTISSTVPADDATGIDPTANLSVTFNENVAKGTGNISIYDSSDSLSEAIDVTSGQVTVSGANVTINPTNTLTDLTGYYVQIDATAIDDTAGNSFAGIGDTTTWSFTTADTTGPTISSTVPTDNATGVDPTANLSVIFDENVAKGTGNISIYDSGDSLFEAIDVTSGQVTVSGTTVTINPTNTLADLTGYYVQIDATAIDDTSGNSFAGISDTTTWSFTTADTTPATDLGAVNYRLLSELDASAEPYYVLETTYDGLLSLVVSNASAGTTSLRLLDAAETALTTDATRVDWDVAAGATYYFQFTGTATNADVAIVNLVDDRTTDVVVHGTSGDDEFVFLPVETTTIDAYLASINGVQYELPPDQLTTISFDGGDGNDEADLTGTSGNDHVLLSPTTAVLTADAFTATVAGTESIAVAAANGTEDVAELTDSDGDDTFAGSASASTMIGSGYRNAVTGFEYTHAYARAGGHDTATLEDTAGDDQLYAEATARGSVARLVDSQGFVRTKFFDVTQANAVNGGTDEASFTDSAGNDHFAGAPDLSTMTIAGYTQSAAGFEVVHAYARNGGTDVAEMTDSGGDDQLVATDEYMKLFGDGFYVRAKFFDAAHGYARNGGNDSARLYGTSGDDTFTATDEWGKLVGANTANRAKFFENVTAYGQGGTDEASFTDSAGDDHFAGGPGLSVMTTTDYTQSAVDFEVVHAYARNGGTDVAELTDSAGDDQLVATDEYMKLFGDGFFVRAKFFDAAHGYAREGGNDSARLYGSSGDDRFTATNEWGRLVTANTVNRAKFFDNVTAYGSDGTDRAYLYDSPGDDFLDATSTTATLTSPTSRNVVQDFSGVRATSENGGTDYDRTEAVDFALEAIGNWIRE